MTSPEGIAYGAPLARTGTVPAAAGDGSYTDDVQNFDLTGVSVVPDSVSVDISGTVTVAGAIAPGVGRAEAVATSAKRTARAMMVERITSTFSERERPHFPVALDGAGSATH